MHSDDPHRVQDATLFPFGLLAREPIFRKFPDYPNGGKSHRLAAFWIGHATRKIDPWSLVVLHTPQRERIRLVAVAEGPVPQVRPAVPCRRKENSLVPNAIERLVVVTEAIGRTLKPQSSVPSPGDRPQGGQPTGRGTSIPVEAKRKLFRFDNYVADWRFSEISLLKFQQKSVPPFGVQPFT